MEVIHIDPKKDNIATVKKAVKVLQKGGVVVHPTETAYGFAADATNTKAIEKIFKLKERNISQTMSLIAASKDMVRKYIFFDERMEHFSKKYWPGPLTIVAKVKSQKLSPLVVRNGTIAIRVSGMKCVRLLSKFLKKPIVSTSANIAGASTPYSAKRIITEWSEAEIQPEMFLNAGKLPRRKTSTIVSLLARTPKILRQGSIHITSNDRV